MSYVIYHIYVYIYIIYHISFGCGPLTVTVTTRIITFLVGDSYKPLFATVTVRGPHPIYHIISYHIISYHIISYHIISYHILKPLLDFVCRSASLSFLFSLILCEHQRPTATRRSTLALGVAEPSQKVCCGQTLNAQKSM